MPHRVSHPFAPARPGGSTLEELVDRHAHLVAVGLANCRAAQALKKEITRRQLERRNAEFETKNSKPETNASLLSNDDDHYNPLEHRDSDGKWTTGPDTTGSKTNSPSQPTKPEPPKEETHLEPASTTEGIGLLLDLAGKGAHDLLAAWAFWRIGDYEDAWKQLGVSSDQLKRAGWPDVEEDEGTAGGTPFDQGKEMLSPPAQVAVTTAERIVESTPRMAIAEADPFLGAYGFGATSQGFDYRQGLLTLFLPVIGKYSGDITAAMAAKTGVSNEAALQAFNKMGGVAGMASFIGADELDRIRKLPPEQQKQALIDAAGTMGSLFIIEMVSHEKSSEPGNPGGDQPGSNAGPEKPTPKTQPESAPSQVKAGAGDSTKKTEPPITLTPYGGPGGGHHPVASAAVRDDPNYSRNEVLAISNSELARLKVKHEVITGKQQILYRDFAKTHKELDWPDIEKIETQALVLSGVKSEWIANNAVKRVIAELKAEGVKPTRIPWGD